MPGVVQEVGDAAGIVGRDPEAARTAHDVAELLARPTHGGRVDDGHELLDVLHEEPVEERLVAVLQGRQADVLLELVGLAPHVLELQGHLLLDGAHARWEQPAQAE